MSSATVPVSARGAGAVRRAWALPDVRAAVFVFLVALGLRLTFVLIVERFGFQLNDTFFYHAIAAQLSDGKGYTLLDDTPTAQWPPVWPVLLSVVYRVFGPEPLAGEITNAVVGSLTAVLLFVVALRVFGRREAVFAGVTFALMPAQIYYADVLLAETLFTFLLVAVFALLLYLPRRAWAYALIGVVIGFAALTRGEGLMLLVVPLAFWWREAERSELLRRIAIVSIAMVVLMTPWTVRNLSVMDEFIPTGTNAAWTFWSGHHSKADGGPSYPPASLLSQVTSQGKEREVEAAALLRREAREYLLEHPVREIELIPQKFLSLNRGDSQAFYFWLVKGDGTRPSMSPRAALRLGLIADIAYYGLLAGFVTTLLVFGRSLLRNPALRAALVYIAAAVVLYSFVLYGNFRYRLPLQPLMILVVAVLAVRLWDLRRSRIATEEPA
jgi:4-amino-4-deoxy-L-arabinose transferase-like glycosyltransferase